MGGRLRLWMSWKKYVHLALSSFHIDTAYPAWYWSHLFVLSGKLILMISFWEAVFDGRDLLDGWTMQAMITYAVLAIIMHEYTSGAAWELSAMIRQGQVAVELLRPYDILWRLMAQDFGAAISNAARTAGPLLLFAVFLFELLLPAEPSIWMLTIFSILLAMILGGFIDLIIGMMAFWLENMWGLRVFKTGLFLFFSGALIPVNLMPDWLQTFCFWTPFPSLVYTPIAVFTGQIAGDAVWLALAVQFGWLIAAGVVLRVLWRFALRQVTVFGG